MLEPLGKLAPNAAARAAERASLERRRAGLRINASRWWSNSRRMPTFASSRSCPATLVRPSNTATSLGVQQHADSDARLAVEPSSRRVTRVVTRARAA